MISTYYRPGRGSEDEGCWMRKVSQGPGTIPGDGQVLRLAEALQEMHFHAVILKTSYAIFSHILTMH